MGREDVAELAMRLVGLPYARAAVSAALAEVDVTAYLGDVGRESVIDLIAP
jgi:hypothetical protein